MIYLITLVAFAAKDKVNLPELIPQFPKLVTTLNETFIIHPRKYWQSYSLKYQ